MDELSADLEMQIHHAASLIRSKKDGVVLTGAGISTPSGIPDFRSEGSGLWRRYDPMVVASLTAFRYNPKEFFEWFRPLACLMMQAQPNPAHIALADLERYGFVTATITQNIDGLHQRAGTHNILEVHGTLETLTCIACYRQCPSNAFIRPYLEEGIIPCCTFCGGILKPDIILFEEQLPKRVWHSAQDACRQCGFILVAGSSLEVTPAANLPLEALNNNAELILVNQTATYLDRRASALLRGDVADILPRLAEEVIHG